jgi:diguanylate cyclase (GGDEF)-like protein
MRHSITSQFICDDLSGLSLVASAVLLFILTVFVIRPLLLEAIAQSLVSNSRESDECFRFGGDEFGMILPLTDANGAFQVADNIRQHIMTLDGLASATVSAGVSCLLDEEKSIDQALIRADQSMYQAKRKSRNVIVISQ